MPDCLSGTVPHIPKDITTRNRIPAQSTNGGGDEDLPPGFTDLMNSIKAEVRTASRQAQFAVNTAMIAMYWRIGKLIIERMGNEGWGTKVVKYIAAELRTTYPEQRGFSERNLNYMLRAARTWPGGILQQPAAKLPWGHTMLMLDKLESPEQLAFYAAAAVNQGWSRATLEDAIRRGLFERHGMASYNFGTTIPDDAEAAGEILKDPYRLEFTGIEENRHTERELEHALIEVISTTQAGRSGPAGVKRTCAT